jgi:hypothetical protein
MMNKPPLIIFWIFKEASDGKGRLAATPAHATEPPYLTARSGPAPHKVLVDIVTTTRFF